jgi:condensin complex subunit 3
MKAAKFNPVELLKIMGATANEEECEKAISVVLETARSGDKAVLNELSDPEIRAFRASVDKHMVQLSDSGVTFGAEEIFFARIACATAQESTDLTLTQKDEIVSKVAPDIPVVCEIFQSHSLRLIQALQEGDRESEDEECFICLQLLQLAKIAGLHEEGSRRHFSSVMKGILSSSETPDDLLEGCIESLRAAHEYENEFLETVSKIVSDISGAEDDSPNEVESLRTLRILSILTIVLETASSKISSHPLLQDFVEIIVSAVSNSNSLVREAGVSCFGKLGLFTEESTVMAEFKPILLKVAVNEKEKLEIRSQALLALSDWSLLFSEILQPCQVEDDTVSFLDIVKEMMQHKNTSVAAIAAEVAAKLLFSGRVCESSLIAHLLVIFFDPNQEEPENDDMDTKEVGSPVRLQQLLSLFFPTYCIKSEHGRDAMLGSINCALGIAQSKKESKSKKRKVAFPLVRIIEFVCSVVDVGREAAASNETSVPSTPKSVVEEPSIRSSAGLLAAIQVAEFLINECSLTVTQTRALCKFMGSQDIGDGEDRMHLRKLKDQMEELGMMVTDGTCLRSLTPLNERLADVESDDEEEHGGVEDSSDVGDASSQGTVTEDEGEESTGETTLEDSLMESMANIAVSHNKENMLRAMGKSRSSTTSRMSEGSVSVLESLGN